MAPKLYDLKLRRYGHDRGHDKFTRAVDLDDPASDVLLAKWLRFLVERDGGKAEDIGEYDMQLREAGTGYVERTFFIAPGEDEER